MKILVYEHITGGGCTGEEIQPSILSEGYAMLRALILDLKAIGCNVVTFIDSRLKEFSPPLLADDEISISSQSVLHKLLKRYSEEVDCVFVIAPESDQTLRGLVEIVESGGASLNCQVDGIERASNKMEVYKTLDRIGLRVPETMQVDIHEDIKEIKRVARELGFPLVFKPVVGVGSSGLSVINVESQIPMAVDKMRREIERGSFIVQRLIDGVAASVSLISTGDEVSPLTLNRQIVTLSPPFSESRYEGGIVPLRHKLEEEALMTAQISVKSLGGLKGYVGVDMVLSSNGPVVVDVNPRLTTSYVGLRRVVNINPAQAIIDAFLEQKLPRDVHVSGYAFFLKVRVPSPPPGALPRIYRLRGVFSPPFPVAGRRESYALIVSHSTTMRGAEMSLHKSRRHLLEIISRGDPA
ncbi:MAG: ATP-grasp domain-containing protein [Candidatus Bathyarchaeia archaeon]